METSQDFPGWVRQMREHIGWSIDDLAVASGVQSLRVTWIETGQVKKPDLRENSLITEALQRGRNEQLLLENGQDIVRHESMVREYTDRTSFNLDASFLAQSNWVVSSTTDVPQRAGCVRLIFLWWLIIFRPPKPHILATYQRTVTIKPPPPGMPIYAPKPVKAA